MNEPFLRLEDVTVERDGQQVLQVADFSASGGCISVLVGDNGAGKTTLLLAAAGLLDLVQGKVHLFGQVFHQGRAPASRQQRRDLAIVFQEPYLFNSSVQANMEYGLKIRKVPKMERIERVRTVLERLGIEDLASRPASGLSGGERKLIALGRALVLRSKALLLDEVTASLDDQARERVLAVIEEEVSERKASVLMATHLDGLASRLKAEERVVRMGCVLPEAKELPTR